MTTYGAQREPAAGATHDPGFSATLESSAVLRLRGELDLASAPVLRVALDPLAGAGCVVTLDLADVTFMDSAGLQVLVGAAQSVGDQGRIVLRRSSTVVWRIMELCGVEHFFEHQ